MKKNLFIMLAVLLAVTIASCKKSADAPADLQSVTENTDPAKKVYNYIIGLGFPAHTIVDQPGEYIVEGDIRFPKDMEVPSGATTEQYYTGSLVSAANVANLRLYVDASMTSMSSEISSAIAQWNAVASCNVNWVVVTSGTYDVLITNYNLGNGVCGQGTFPSGGRAGNLIRINKNYIAGNSFAQRARTICHELGHNVSLRHTNWSAIGESSATAVPGVGGTDASSLMNGGQCGSGATTLSTKDKNAIAALY